MDLQLKYLPYFDKMLEWNGSKEDWKRSFNAMIPFVEFEIYNEAAEFFTGATLEVVGWANNVGEGECLVLCKGYYEVCGS